MTRQTGPGSVSPNLQLSWEEHGCEWMLSVAAVEHGESSEDWKLHQIPKRQEEESTAQNTEEYHRAGGRAASRDEPRSASTGPQDTQSSRGPWSNHEGEQSRSCIQRSQLGLSLPNWPPSPLSC